MKRIHVSLVVASLCIGLLPALPAASKDDEAVGFERTPPRLSFTDGDVSFLRVGASDWTPASVNTPLAPGDELYAGADSNLEIQVGPRAYMRAGEDTQVGLVNLEPDYLQIHVTSGSASLDLRSLPLSHTIEIDTPNAAFTVGRTGYYRVEVVGDSTSFTTRRGGRATVSLADGSPANLEPSEQVVVTGTDTPTIESYAAPEIDTWDRWNYARTDDLLDAVSARYVSPDVYGVADLDHYGDWRLVPTYGAVWVPRAVPAGWVPYSTGRWILDPYYGWSWVDSAPWGWAPYHYGRWVRLSGYWAWAPGPIVVRPYYAPALVAFYGGGGFSVGISIGTPYVGWVALGWGEPLLPWWGPVGFRSTAHWARWGGPHVVNRVVVKRTTVIHAKDVHQWDHARERRSIVTVPRDHFGRRSSRPVSFSRGDVTKLEPLRGELRVKSDRTSFSPSRGTAARPRREVLERPMVATRRPQAPKTPKLETKRTRDEIQRPVRVVQPPREARSSQAPKRPPFAHENSRERQISPPAPRFEELRRQSRSSSATTARTREATPPPPRESTRARPAPGSRPQTTRESSAPRARELPGESANRVWRGRSTASPRSAPRRDDATPSPQTRSPRTRSPEARTPETRSPQRGSESQGRGNERGRSGH